MADTRSTEVPFACGYVEYSRLPPHEAGRYTSLTRPFGFGVSFTGHRAAELRAGSDAVQMRSFGPGTVGINGPRTLTWLDVAESSESVDIHPTPEVLDAVAAATGCRWPDLGDFQQLTHDDVIWGHCIAFRTAVLRQIPIPQTLATTLITNVAMHVAIDHLGGRRPREFTGRLDSRTVARVGAHLRGHHRRVVPLDEMAAVAMMSPFHFHRAFRRTVGVTPAAFAMTVRLERAHRAIAAGASTRHAAEGIGIFDPAQFRRTYRRFFGTSRITE